MSRKSRFTSGPNNVAFYSFMKSKSLTDAILFMYARCCFVVLKCSPAAYVLKIECIVKCDYSRPFKSIHCFVHFCERRLKSSLIFQDSDQALFFMYGRTRSQSISHNIIYVIYVTRWLRSRSPIQKICVHIHHATGWYGVCYAKDILTAVRFWR